jgi:hypothetical protein
MKSKKKELKLPTLAEVEELTAIARKEHEKRKRVVKPRPLDDPDEEAYQKMFEEILRKIGWACRELKTEFVVELGTRQHETIENKRKRAALEKIKVLLRELNYQTSWNHDVIEDDGFNRDIFDTFTVSWAPDIRWNEFRY